MYRIPSERTLVQAFGIEKGRALRAAFELHRDRFPFKRPALRQACEILGGEDVEGFYLKDNRLCAYVNMGDTYATTILRIGNSLQVGSWGDVAERFCD